MAGTATGSGHGLRHDRLRASADETKDEIVVAIVSNPQMQDAMELQDEFAKAHPDVNVKFVSLPENEARAKITASVATGGGEFDVVMISNYETPIWAENGWIENLQPYIDKTEGYDDQDFIGSIRNALSYEDDMYSVPFYGESSFLVYNEELFKKAGVAMPENPTWPEINELAAKLDDPDNGVSGICLRGLAGWGEVMAPLSTVMNTYGGGWFDEDWNPTLTSPETKQAVNEYVNLVREHGQPGAATSGYGDCITRYSQGNAAMWYDATAMVSSIEIPHPPPWRARTATHRPPSWTPRTQAGSTAGRWPSPAPPITRMPRGTSCPG
ncbi:ABC transporter substrate-binding protein [Kocuria atrinae]|uniref:ABC transporter substrate-binding protein n=1 Tax=Kocuria atrinae TaxID=592377 RepID=UPI0002DA0E17|nr:extracellular solute-binding protein [Kocuria atrinae]